MVDVHNVHFDLFVKKEPNCYDSPLSICVMPYCKPVQRETLQALVLEQVSSDQLGPELEIYREELLVALGHLEEPIRKSSCSLCGHET